MNRRSRAKNQKRKKVSKDENKKDANKIVRIREPDLLELENEGRDLYRI